MKAWDFYIKGPGMDKFVWFNRVFTQNAADWFFNHYRVTYGDVNVRMVEKKISDPLNSPRIQKVLEVHN